MIDFFNLAAQQAEIKSDIDTRIARVLSHGKYILGPEVYELEEKLVTYTGAKCCITCANGTDALQISLMSIGIGPGDEVIMPNFSYIATAEAAAVLGATPVYVDVDPDTYTINPELIEEAVTPLTKAIIPVSLYGTPAKFDAINKIAEKHSLFVIEDAAQSFGAEYHAQKSCNLTHIACTSFFPTKPLGCYGDGGAVFTNDAKLANSIRQIARHGQERRYHHVQIGLNSRMDTIQAAILLCKLPKLEQEIDRKNEIALQYLSSINSPLVIKLPELNNEYRSSWAQFTVQFQQRERVRKALSNLHIPTAIHYPLPLSEQPALFNGTVKTKYSKQLSDCVLSVPINAYMTNANVQYITESINNLSLN